MSARLCKVSTRTWVLCRFAELSSLHSDGKAFATFTSHTGFLLFLPVGAISLQQDVAAATRVPTWAGPSEVLDRRVAQWNLGLSGRIVPTSAPTLSWLSVGVAPAAELTAVFLRASRSDFAREPKTQFYYVTSFRRNAVILLDCISLTFIWVNVENTANL